jgi:hypothetical protein
MKKIGVIEVPRSGIGVWRVLASPQRTGFKIRGRGPDGDRPRNGGASGALPECLGKRRRTAPSAATVGLEGRAHAHRRPDRRERHKLDPGMHSSEHCIMLLRQRVDAWASKLKVTPRLVRVQRILESTC